MKNHPLTFRACIEKYCDGSVEKWLNKSVTPEYYECILLFDTNSFLKIRGSNMQILSTTKYQKSNWQN